MNENQAEVIKPVGSKQLLAEMQAHPNSLFISEMFASIQGEGPTRGVPSIFLRLASCTLSCVWCDTTEVWMHGQEWMPGQLTYEFGVKGWLDKLFHKGWHLILTGGSPLLQQEKLVAFLALLMQRPILPYIEVETEGVITPSRDMYGFVRQWNVSPKLSNSRMAKERRYKEPTLAHHRAIQHSYFKFVVGSPEDLQELEEDFVGPFGLNSIPERVYLMPQASTRQELAERSQMVAEYCIKTGFRFSSRDQVTIWDRTTGV